MNTELSFEYILKKDNNWLLFKELYKDELSPDLIYEVEKMLKCCSSECGFAKYICPHCGHTKTIPFSCKSKLCSRCGKKHVDIWSQIVSLKLLNCIHKHIVLTISNKLWPFFINNPSLQKLLLDTAANIIKEIFSRKHKLSIGLILVLHPFGDDLKPNFHIHAIVTAGGLSKDNNLWSNVDYLPYEVIRKTWQYQILSALRKHLPQSKSTLQPIINWCFTYRKNGFYSFVKNIPLDSKHFTLSYVARYTRHPPISKRRILNYDGCSVTFSYESNGKLFTKTMPKFDFILAVLKLTTSKHFKTVRRFGLYSRRSYAKYAIAKSLLPTSSTVKSPLFNWRSNITSFSNNDPLICEKCSHEMLIYSITYRDKFGSLKTIDKDDWLYQYSTEPIEKLPKYEKQRWRQLLLSEMHG